MKPIRAVRIIYLLSFLLLCSCVQVPKVALRAPLVVSHRGYDASQNSSLAISRAFAAGAQVVELDLREIPSGDFILFHDKRLDANNFSGPPEFIGRPVNSLTPTELNLISHPDGGQILLFHNLEHLDGTFLLDVKSEQIESYLKLAPLLVPPSRFIVLCQTVPIFQTLRNSYPSLKLLLRAKTSGQLRALTQLKPDFIQGDLQWLTTELVSELHAAGILILVKTLNEVGDTTESWKKALNLGVDAILTDNPAALVRFLRARQALKAWPPPFGPVKY